MSAIPSRRRRLVRTAALSGVASLALLPVGGWMGVQAILGSSGGSSVDAIGTLKIPATPVALLASVNDVEQVTSLTAFVLDPSGVGGTIVSLPAGARAEELPDEEPHRIGDTYTLSGAEAFAFEVEGLLDVSFSAVAGMKSAELAALFAPLPAVSVTFDVPLVNTSMEIPPPSTTIRPTNETTLPPQPVPVDREVYPAGERSLTPDELVTVLLAQRLGEPEASRLPRMRSMWQGVAAAVGTGIGPAVGTSPTGTPDSVADFFTRLIAGPVQVWQLSYAPLSGEANPNGVDMYGLDPYEVLMVMASVAPSSLALPSEALAVQLDSPFSDAELTRTVIERLSLARISVALVREVGGTPAAETVVLFHDDQVAAATADDLNAALGPVSIGQWKQRVEGLFAQIILGQNLVDFLAGSPPVPTTVPSPADDTGGGPEEVGGS